jgi:hypothetical protein
VRCRTSEPFSRRVAWEKWMNLLIFSFSSLYASLDSMVSLLALASVMAFSTAMYQPSRSSAFWASKECLEPETLKAKTWVPSLWRSVA